MTAREKELLAQQAEARGLFDTARTLREYLSLAGTAADVTRTQVLAKAYGWNRLAGWRLLKPRLTVRRVERA